MSLRTDLIENRDHIANSYAELIRRNGEFAGTLATRQGWADLAADSEQRAAGVRLLLDVRETDDPEPYPDAVAMCEDIAQNRRFVVSRANSDHPVWSINQNVAFRIVHDVLGHYAATVGTLQCRPYIPEPVPPILGEWSAECSADVAGFDWEGECRACCAHVPLLPSRNAAAALFTECLGQTAYAIARGEFGPQCVGFMGPYVLGRQKGGRYLGDVYLEFVRACAE